MATAIHRRRDLKTVCRACLKTTVRGNYLLLSHEPIREVFVQSLNIYIPRQDQLPLRICKNCVEKCRKYLEFRKECHANDRVLKEAVAEMQEEEPPIIQEIIKLDMRPDTKQVVKELMGNAETVPVIIEENIDNIIEECIDETTLNDGNMDLESEEKLWEEFGVEETVDDTVPTNGSSPSPVDDEEFTIVTFETMDKIEILCPICLLPNAGHKAFESHVISHTDPKKMICSLCMNVYHRRDGFQFHMYIHTNLRFECGECGKRFNGPKVLKDHMREQHQKFQKTAPKELSHHEAQVNEYNTKTAKRPPRDPIPENEFTGAIVNSLDSIRNIKCPICGVICDTRTIFDVHIVNHISRVKKECPICYRKFLRMETVKNHLITHTNVRFKCQYCNMKYLNPKSLRGHMNTVHDHGKNENLRNGGEHCKHCGKYFRYLSGLHEHMKSCAKQAMVQKCDSCDMTFTTQVGLSVHKKVVHERATCNLCDVELAERGHMSGHLMDVHTKDQKCGVCQLTVADYDKLLAHMKTHNRTHFTCEICGLVCNTAQKYKEHVNRHSGCKPFICATCGKAFAAKRNMVAHVKAVHMNIKQKR